MEVGEGRGRKKGKGKAPWPFFAFPDAVANLRLRDGNF